MIDLPDVDSLMTAGLRDWLDQKAAERAKARERREFRGIGNPAAGAGGTADPISPARRAAASSA